MSTNGKSFSHLTTQSGVDGILYEKYLFSLKRSNKNGSQYWVCTHKQCSASINIYDKADKNDEDYIPSNE